jgi:hypothetical protein
MAIMQGSAALLAGAMALGVLASLLTGMWFDYCFTKPKYMLHSCVLTISPLEKWFSFCG